MSILDKLKRNRSIPPHATFRLTQEGRDKLQDFAGDPKSRIFMALETRGTSTVDEISDASHLSRGQVERMIPGLVNGQYVQYVSRTSVEEAEL